MYRRRRTRGSSCCTRCRPWRGRGRLGRRAAMRFSRGVARAFWGGWAGGGGEVGRGRESMRGGGGGGTPGGAEQAYGGWSGGLVGDGAPAGEVVRRVVSEAEGVVRGLCGT